MSTASQALTNFQYDHLSVKMFAPFKTSGVLGDGSDDTPCFVAAFAYAQSFTPPLRVDVPHLDIGPYNLTSAGGQLNLTQDFHLRGLGKPVINFTGTGILFTNTGARDVIVENLNILGNFIAGAFAIKHATSVLSAINCHYHHLNITNFGTNGGDAGGSAYGGGIWIDSDSLALSIGPKCLLANLNVNILVTANTDSFRDYDNEHTVPGAYPSGPTRALDFTADLGSAIITISHSNSSTQGLGFCRINGGGQFTIEDLNFESPVVSGSPVLLGTNNNGAIISCTDAIVIVRGNSINSHNAASYAVYVDDTVTNSQFYENISNNVLLYTFRVGSGVENSYYDNASGSGPSTVYSADYIGIVNYADTGSGVVHGKAVSSDQNFSFAAPDAPATSYKPILTLRSVTNPLYEIGISLDSASGTAFILALKDGVGGIPIVLNPGVPGNATETPSLNITPLQSGGILVEKTATGGSAAYRGLEIQNAAASDNYGLNIVDSSPIFAWQSIGALCLYLCGLFLIGSATFTYALFGVDNVLGRIIINGLSYLWPSSSLPTTGEVLTALNNSGQLGWSTPAGTGTVTHTAGALTAGQLVLGNGGADIAAGDLTGDVSTSGSNATTLATVVVAGFIPIPKLTTGGTNGSITTDAKGRIVSWSAPT